MPHLALRAQPSLVIARRAKPDAAIHGWVTLCTEMDFFVALLLAMMSQWLSKLRMALGRP